MEQGGQKMRLIDADRLMYDLRGNVLIDVVPELEETILQQPTAFDKEKVIEELKGEIELCVTHPLYPGRYIKKDRAVEIVEKGGIE